MLWAQQYWCFHVLLFGWEGERQRESPSPVVLGSGNMLNNRGEEEKSIENGFNVQCEVTVNIRCFYQCKWLRLMFEFQAAAGEQKVWVLTLFVVFFIYWTVDQRNGAKCTMIPVLRNRLCWYVSSSNGTREHVDLHLCSLYCSTCCK